MNERIKLSTMGKNHQLIGNSKAVESLKRDLKKVHQSELNTTVLISGESGSGKEVFARYLNALGNTSESSSKPFIAVNCTSIPKELFEAEFFGYEKGAFTGAGKKKIGYFELAHGGDIFLDEIGNMPLEFQGKLLRTIQEKTIHRIGSHKEVKSDFRVIAATNADLKKRVEEKRFRIDLYYRLKVVSLHVPPLREHKEDISPLVEHFIRILAVNSKKTYLPLDQQIIDLFMEYDWPGNIRELKNVIENLIILGFDGQYYDKNVLPESILFRSMSKKHLASLGNEGRLTVEEQAFSELGMNFNPLFEDFLNDPAVKAVSSELEKNSTLDFNCLKFLFERSIARHVLEKHNNNVGEAAKVLGIPKGTFYYRIKHLGLSGSKTLYPSTQVSHNR